MYTSSKSSAYVLLFIKIDYWWTGCFMFNILQHICLSPNVVYATCVLLRCCILLFQKYSFDLFTYVKYVNCYI